jgi:hypothetical protein
MILWKYQRKIFGEVDALQLSQGVRFLCIIGDCHESTVQLDVIMHFDAMFSLRSGVPCGQAV